MAKWSVTYNDFGSEGNAQYQWSHVNITSQTSEPVFSPDEISVESVKHTISGTALISETTDANYRLALLHARERLTKPPKANTADGLTALRVFLDLADDGTGTQEMSAGIYSTTGEVGLDAKTDSYDTGSAESGLYYGFQEDDYGVPTCSFSIDEIYGTRTALVSFTFTWHKIEPPSASVAYHVLSHTWTQSYSIDESGSTNLVIDGELRVRSWMDDEQINSGTSDQRGTNPDRYRTLVMPAVPTNFRVESMRWATDKSGNKLIYRISLQEHARPLPYPAKKGTGRFTYQRSIGNLMGVKMFDGELEGDVNSDPRELLNSLIRIAASRIRFGGGVVPGDAQTANDLIQSVTVSENEIFSKKSISLRIVAQGMQTLSKFGEENDPDGNAGPGFNMLSPFFQSGELTTSERPNAHGSSMIQSVKRQLFLPWNPNETDAWTDTDFPQALWRRADEWSGEDVSLEFEDSVLAEPAPPHLSTGEHNNADPESTGMVEHPYGHMSGTESITVKSNVVVMSGQSLASQDVVYQTAKPVVLVESEYRVSRLGKPPKRFMLNKPRNGVVLEETFDVNRGDVDANNNRNYIGVYRRVVRLLYNAHQMGGFYLSEFTLPEWGTTKMMHWWPPLAKLASPADPRFEEKDNVAGEIWRTVFDVPEGSDESNADRGVGRVYELGNRPSIYG